MISHYTAIVWIVACSMGIMIASIKGNHFISPKNKHYFALLFLLLIITNLAEWLAASINGGDPALRPLHILSKFTEFNIAPMIPAFSVAALGGAKWEKWLGIPIGINFLFQCVSLFSGIIFSVDAGSVYHRGPLYPAYVAAVLCGMSFLLIHCIRFSRRYQYQNMVFLSLIVLLVIFAMVSQMAYSYLRLDWVCVSIAAIMFYIYYDQLVQQVDTLTTLLNRRSYEVQIAQLKKPADILFFDVDQFKNANDTYGHGFGDTCLLRLALETKKVFGKLGYCYRYGGDEFCAVLTRRTEDPEELISAYLRGINDLRLQDERLPYVSIGYTTYDPARESIQEAVARADAIMYQFKAAHRTRQEQNN